MTDSSQGQSPENDTSSGEKTEAVWAAWRAGQMASLDEVLAQAAKLTPRQLLEVLLEDQTQRWQRGERVSAETYLQRYSQLQTDPALVVDLIYGEYLLASKGPNRQPPERYLERFPKYRNELVRQFELEGGLADSQLADSQLVDTRDGEAADTNDGPEQRLWMSSEAAPIEPGDFGEYRLLEEIARGGMGRVFKAYQKGANRIVALKMILRGRAAGEREVKRFFREAEAAASLQHPNVVPVFDVGVVDGQHFYTMAYVRGQSLRDRLDEGPLPVREATEVVRQVASAVSYAHQQGIVHRDLKPSNIMLDPDNTPRVTDFGLVKRIGGESDLTATGEPVGTLAFMAPEQALGAKIVSTRSDIYSLGAVLYCLLAGRPPFEGATPMDTWRQVVQCHPVSPRQLNANVSRDLETVCLKCLDKEPWRRYGSAEELSAELQHVLQDEPIRARPISTTVRTWRWCWRNPVAAMLVGLIVVLAIGGPLVAWQASLLATRNHDLAVQHELEAERARRAQRQAESEKTKARHALEREKAATRFAEEQTRLAEEQTQLAIDRLGQSHRALYNQQLLRASRELESNPEQALRLLQDGERCRPELLDFTYHYLQQRVDQDRR